MDLQLQDQVAVIIGAAQGIGRAIAAAFSNEHANVALLDIDPAVQNTAQEIGAATGRPTLALPTDATDFAAVTAAAERVIGRFGDCHHVVYAAGAGSGKYGFPFWNLQPGDWPRVLQINLLGAVHAAHAFTPRMIAARRGTLTFLSSIAGQIGSQTDPPYSAAKAGLINFAQCAAKDLAPFDVRVNTICPGMIKTSVNRAVWQAWHAQQPPENRLSYEQWADEKVARVTPLGRWQDAEDIAAMAVFLASVNAKNITGQTINVDGGTVMHW